MIDNKTIEQARNADIIAFLEKYYRFTFSNKGNSYRCKQHPSLAVKADRRSFYWHSKGVGGFGVLDYLTKVENMPFREAMGMVVGSLPIATEAKVESPKVLVLPEKAGIPLKLYDYLCLKRDIDSDIVNTLMQKEMLYEDKRGNVVFVGYDERNKPRFASLRGTHGDFRGDCLGSDKRYGFNMAADAPSERLYIFESAIDAMSHASLDKSTWEQHHRLSLSGTSDTAVQFFLNQHREVKELAFCLDNDPVGREVAVSLARKYAGKGYLTRIELPSAKDFNGDLQERKLQLQARKPCNLNNDISI